MAESTPPSRARLDDDLPRSSRPLRLIDPGVRASQPSHPPSEPRPIAGRPGADAGPERASLVQGRVQLIAALLLLLVLVVVPLYLWRRPRAAATDEAKPTASALASTQSAEPAPTADPKVKAKDGVTISDAKVIACHDPGSHRTAPGACDRLPTFEAALSKAILDSSSCVAPGTPAGAIAFVADVSYARHKNPIHLKAGREGTTMHSKVAAACVADVKKALGATALDQAHGHARYDVEVDATYASKR